MTRAPFDLMMLRKRIGLTQAEMAAAMGMGSRAYFTLEQAPASINRRHVMLAQMVSLKEAVRQQDPRLADPEIALLADEYTRLPPQGR